jgi:hypothetical protein
MIITEKSSYWISLKHEKVRMSEVKNMFGAGPARAPWLRSTGISMGAFLAKIGMVWDGGVQDGLS